MGTTPNGYPYPEDTDPTNQGAQAIKAFATAVDTRVRSSCAGRATLTFSNASTATAAITFPVGRFVGAVPAVVVTPGGTSTLYGYLPSGPSLNGATVAAHTYDNSNKTMTVSMDWVATQI